MFGRKLNITHQKLYILFVICILISVAAGSRYLYNQWQSNNEAWAQTKTEFENCNLFSVLDQLGYRQSTVQELYSEKFQEPILNGAYLLALKRVASDKALDLDAVTLGTNKWSISVTSQGTSGRRLLDICKRLVHEGNENVALNVGRFYLITQKAQALPWLETAAEGGIPAAYRLLGIAHRKGILNSIKDENKAFAYFMKAANAGDRLAKLYVSEMYRSIDPVNSNLFLAAAAEQGSLTAAYRLQKSIRDPSKQYFWALVFQFIRNSELKKQWFDQDIEDYSVYRWEGLPEIVAPTELLFGANPTREIIYNYNKDEAKRKLDSLERELSLPNRVVVQELFQRWVAEKYKKETSTSSQSKKPKSTI
jgi:hypothetical protein